MTKRCIIKALTIVPKLNDTERPEFLGALGFTRFKVKNPYCEIYRNEDLRIVVKNGFFIGHAPTDLQVKTTLLDHGRKIKHTDRVWVRQPLCDTQNTAKALHLVEKKLAKRKRKLFVDVHQWNVGFYNRKPVLFDW